MKDTIGYEWSHPYDLYRASDLYCAMLQSPHTFIVGCLIRGKRKQIASNPDSRLWPGTPLNVKYYKRAMSYAEGKHIPHYPVPAIPMRVLWEARFAIVVERYKYHEALIDRPGDWRYLFNW